MTICYVKNTDLPFLWLMVTGKVFYACKLGFNLTFFIVKAPVAIVLDAFPALSGV